MTTEASGIKELLALVNNELWCNGKERLRFRESKNAWGGYELQPSYSIEGLLKWMSKEYDAIYSGV